VDCERRDPHQAWLVHLTADYGSVEDVVFVMRCAPFE